ncbi:MAG: hypothetical protein JW725_01195 [Candidatus Babeliaceae bacterium]|nr:hypothetical protein [Candidatus Babeliaceae bacterium]
MGRLPIVWGLLAVQLVAAAKDFVMLDLDNTLSDSAKEQIRRVVSDGKIQGRDAGKMLALLREDIPALKWLVIQKRFDVLPSLLISYDEPYLNVCIPGGDSLILSREKTYTPSKAFRADIVGQVPCLTLEIPESCVSSHLPFVAQWAVQAPAEIWNSYRISWHGIHYLSLVPKTFPLRRFVITADQPLTDQFFSLVRWVCARRLPPDGTKTPWCIDMRFRGRLILIKEGKLK